MQLLSPPLLALVTGQLQYQRHLHLWQSWVEIEDYSVRNVLRKTRFKLAVVYLVFTTIVGSFQATYTHIPLLGGSVQLSVAS